MIFFKAKEFLSTRRMPIINSGGRRSAAVIGSSVGSAEPEHCHIMPSPEWINMQSLRKNMVRMSSPIYNPACVSSRPRVITKYFFTMISVYLMGGAMCKLLKLNFWKTSYSNTSVTESTIGSHVCAKPFRRLKHVSA